jgi:glycosyltransferase involved in cell wall biosynthesis
MVVTVVIPVKDRKEALLRALRSVLAQTCPVEIIVIDDGSLQSMESDVKDLNDKIVYKRKSFSEGAPQARNEGWQLASTELVAFLDSDDELEPECLFNKVEHLRKYKLDMVVGSIKLGDGKSLKSYPYAPNEKISLRDNLLGNNLFDARTSTFLMRKDTLKMVSFDEKLRKHQDWDLFINVDRQFKVGYTNLCDTVIHVSQTDRISNTLKHESTAYFVKKNKYHVDPNALFLFMVKMLFRAQRINDTEGEKIYKEILATEFVKLSVQNRILQKLLVKSIISAKMLHFLKRLVKR